VFQGVSSTSPTFVTNVKNEKESRTYYNIQSPEDGSRSNCRNVVYIRNNYLIYCSKPNIGHKCGVVTRR